MARGSTYLNFRRETEAAFEFYRSVFGGEFTMLGRFRDMPQQGAPRCRSAARSCEASL